MARTVLDGGRPLVTALHEIPLSVLWNRWLEPAMPQLAHSSDGLVRCTATARGDCNGSCGVLSRSRQVCPASMESNAAPPRAALSAAMRWAGLVALVARPTMLLAARELAVAAWYICVQCT